MAENKVSLWSNGKVVFLKGDTFRHPGELWRFGFRYDHARQRWVAPRNLDPSVIAALNAKPKRGVHFRRSGSKCWVSGETHLFCQTFESWGGRCKEGSRTWHFTNEDAQKRLLDFENKITEANKLGEQVVIEAFEKYEDYQRKMIENAVEVDSIVQQLFNRADGNFWWPATLGNPCCSHCKFNLVWYWYYRNDKDMEKTLATRMPLICANCKHDYSR